jgi:hypothetical protein
VEPGTHDDRELLAARPRVPDHVVARGFGDESVALNLSSGRYHGLNEVAALMFERLREAQAVGDVVEPLATEFGQPREVIERDLIALVRGLEERGLVELDGGTGP